MPHVWWPVRSHNGRCIRALNELKVLTLLTLKDADPNCLDSKGRHALYSLHPPEDIADDIHFSKRVVIAQLLAAFGAKIPASEALWITLMSDCAKKIRPWMLFGNICIFKIHELWIKQLFRIVDAYLKVTVAGPLCSFLSSVPRVLWHINKYGY